MVEGVWKLNKQIHFLSFLKMNEIESSPGWKVNVSPGRLRRLFPGNIRKFREAQKVTWILKLKDFRPNCCHPQRATNPCCTRNKGMKKNNHNNNNPPPPQIIVQVGTSTWNVFCSMSKVWNKQKNDWTTRFFILSVLKKTCSFVCRCANSCTQCCTHSMCAWGWWDDERRAFLSGLFCSNGKCNSICSQKTCWLILTHVRSYFSSSLYNINSDVCVLAFAR